jgi:putative transposase
MTLFRNKFRVESARLPGRDYASGGKYFVTICTLNRKCLLGEIIGIEMRLSEVGRIVADEWNKTATLRPNVQLDAWQIMPNHVHGILVLNHPGHVGKSALPRVAPQQVPIEGLKADSLGAIINQFKGNCTKRIRELGQPGFHWQPRFYDHIIQNERSLVQIRQYIHDNPRKWAEDSDNPVNWIHIYRKERDQRKRVIIDNIIAGG